MRRDFGRAVRRVVVKVGSAVLARDGVLERACIRRMAADVGACLAGGVEGVVLVSSGAVASGFRALGLAHPPRAIAERGASLLPSGIRAVEGTFEAGAVVELAGPDGRVFARGLASYGAAEVAKIRGMKVSQIESALGCRYADEVVHRDDLALVDGAAMGAGKGGSA